MADIIVTEILAIQDARRNREKSIGRSRSGRWQSPQGCYLSHGLDGGVMGGEALFGHDSSIFHQPYGVIHQKAMTMTEQTM